MSENPSRFAKLAELSKQTTSEARRELLREVTEAMSQRPDADIAAFDSLLTAVASDYSAQVRADLAKLVAANPQFACSAQLFAMDDIAVAEPVLRHSRILSDETLLKVIDKNSQSHMLVVAQRPQVSERISHALVEKGDDHVVVSLLANDNARIASATYEKVAIRAEGSILLQAPLVRRADVPADLLNDLYLKVEGGLRQEILKKFDHLSEDEIEQAFHRSRERLSRVYSAAPEDMAAANKRLDILQRSNELLPPILVSLLREGDSSRTAFIAAFARLTDVEFNLIQRTITNHDLDTMALLCRGANFDRALFVTLAITLAGNAKGLGAAEQFGKLYEAVPVVAQRALRFWKVRAAA